MALVCARDHCQLTVHSRAIRLGSSRARGRRLIDRSIVLPAMATPHQQVGAGVWLQEGYPRRGAALYMDRLVRDL